MLEISRKYIKNHSSLSILNSIDEIPNAYLWPQPNNDKSQNPKLKSNPNDKCPKKNPDDSKQCPAKGPVTFWTLSAEVDWHLGFGI
jgi:hypothetical protein